MSNGDKDFDKVVNDAIRNAPKAVKSQWDYKLALLIITVLAFVTRFWGITHPNQVVFDEVHFGKVRGNDGIPWAAVLASMSESLTRGYSSLRIISKERTSSMSTLPLASCSSPSLGSWLATMASSSSRTLATRTSPTRSLMSLTELCPPPWEH